MANKRPFILAFGMHLVSFVLCCMAYGTGYWYEGDGRSREFKRLGLWEACFDGYEHTSDYIGKAYYGCWWIFHKEYSYIRGWIMPEWFISVQTLMTFALVFEFIGLVLFPLCLRDKENVRSEIITSINEGLMGACLTISVCVFAVMIGEDRTWMPRFDINVLGWSFGLAVTAGFLAVFACICMTVYTLMKKYELLPRDDAASAPLKKGSLAMFPMEPKI